MWPRANPNAPTLTAGKEHVVVSWSAPNNSGSDITDYDVQYSSNNGSTWTEWNANNTSTTTTATITGLTNGTAYQVQVRAENALIGAWSNSATVTTPDKPDAPDSPTLYIGNAALKAVWTAPDNNGSTITDYDVRVSSDSGSSWTETERHRRQRHRYHHHRHHFKHGQRHRLSSAGAGGQQHWQRRVVVIRHRHAQHQAANAHISMEVAAHNFTLHMETTFATDISGWQWRHKTNPELSNSWWRDPQTIDTTNKKYSLANPSPLKGLANNVVTPSR